MDPECRTYIQVALKFSSVWSELVGLSKTKGGKVLTPLTRCNDYQQFWLHFEWFLQLSQIWDVK